MARDFRAEAITKKKQQQEADRAAARYEIRPRKYEFMQRPAGMADEPWRALCEARWLIYAMTTQEQRRLYLAGVEKHRGITGRMKLEEDARRVWNEKQ